MTESERMNPAACREDSIHDTWHVLHSVMALQHYWRDVLIVKNDFDMHRYFDLINEKRFETIVEVGLQAGGSLLFFLDCLKAVNHDAHYIGIDINCRFDPNVVERIASNDQRLTIINGDSLDPQAIEIVRPHINGKSLVILDSLHTKEHVDKELALYAPLLAPGSYLVVEDTDHGGHPVLANYGPSAWESVQEFLANHAEFSVDTEIENRYGPYTNCPSGWLVKANDCEGGNDCPGTGCQT